MRDLINDSIADLHRKMSRELEAQLCLLGEERVIEMVAEGWVIETWMDESQPPTRLTFCARITPPHERRDRYDLCACNRLRFEHAGCARECVTSGCQGFSKAIPPED